MAGSPTASGRSTRLIGALMTVVVTLGLSAGCSGSNDARAAAVTGSAVVSSAAASPVAASSAAGSPVAGSPVAAAAAAAVSPSARVKSAPAASSVAADAAETTAADAVDPDAVDPDAPGDDHGKPCPADPRYVDEAPIGLRPDVAAAWAAATKTARAAGIVVCLNDGKRSRAQQQATFDNYVRQFGAAMARQYVLPPAKSAHVLGFAVDVQPYAAYIWLERTGGALGFCRRYDNEAWHFEFEEAYRSSGCPARLPRPGG
jgi:D-alanyl-D-alanine carboxypeptidase